TGTDANGCVNDTTVEVFVNPLPVISIAQNNPEVCITQSFLLVASGAPSLVWNTDASLNTLNNDSVFASPSVNTTYTVVGTDANACVDSATVLLTVNPLPTIVVNPSAIDTICLG